MRVVGISGERLVFNLLKNKYGYSNVCWESRYAKEVGENVEGTDFNHYDIRYRNPKGDWVFVEVKTTKTDATDFELTKAEYEFGLENKGNYEIFHVRNIEDDEPTYRVFRLFEDDFQNSSEFSVIPNGYIIKYEEL